MENTAQSHEVSFGVYPPVTRIITAPHAAVASPISVFNNTNDILKLDIVLRAFRASDAQDGTIQYYTAKDTPTGAASFLNTVKIEDNKEQVKEINLYPNEYKKLTIIFPGPVQPQDNYFSVIFLNKATEAKTDVSIIHVATGVAANVLVTEEKAASIVSITPELKTKSFLLAGPAKISLTLTNNSDSFISTSGNIYIYDIFGNRTARLPLKPAIILANSSRVITAAVPVNSKTTDIVWGEKFLMGFYTVKASIAVNKTSSHTYETHFFAIPLFILLVSTLILFIVLSILYRALKKLNFKES